MRRELGTLENPRLIIRGTNYSDSLAEEPPVHLENTSVRIRIVEPVKELFKDEIRRVAAELLLPAAICQRQAFPGGGLALRIWGTVSEERLEALRLADAIFCEEIEAAGQQKRLWQYYAQLFCLDGEKNEYWQVVLRALQATGSNAVAARLPSDLLERVSERITAQLPKVRRVLYDLSRSRTYRLTGD